LYMIYHLLKYKSAYCVHSLTYLLFQFHCDDVVSTAIFDVWFVQVQFLLASSMRPLSSCLFSFGQESSNILLRNSMRI
jgi:hypothetical protein